MAEGSIVQEPKPKGGPTFPGGTPPQDEERAAVAVSTPIMFCGHPPHDFGKHTDEVDHGGAAACVMLQNLWKGRQALKVWFMNPEKLEEKGWKYCGKKITTDLILEWANVWNPDSNEKIPEFEAATRVTKSDIRVKFIDDSASWSMVGMQAEKVDNEKPTMALNVDDGSCYMYVDKRSLIIHEFGHALGLDHEHQRSDFWDGVEKHIDVDTMKDDPRVKHEIAREGKAAFGDGWFHIKANIRSSIRRMFSRRSKSVPTGKIESEYDSKSIMHYGFDKDWLKNPNHRDIRVVRSISEEELPAKKYIMGILERHNSLAEGPSSLDLKILQQAYECCSDCSK